MSFLFSKLVAVLTSIVAVLTFQQATISQVPTPSPSPVVALESATPTPAQIAQTASPTPVKTVAPTPTSTPDLPALINQIGELQQAIASYTPEPTPTPQIVYVPQIVSTPVPTPAINDAILNTQRVVDDGDGNAMASLQIFLPSGMDKVIITDFTATVSGLSSQKGIFFTSELHPGNHMNVDRTGDTTFHFSGKEISDGVIGISLGDGPLLYSSLAIKIDSLSVTDLNGNPIQVNLTFPIQGGKTELRHY